jgi:hypothetical protein
MWAKTVCPFSSSTEKVVLGKTCLIVPKSSNGASLFEVSTEGARGARRLTGRPAMVSPLRKKSYLPQTPVEKGGLR